MKAKAKSKHDSTKLMLKRAREFSKKEQDVYRGIIEASLEASLEASSEVELSKTVQADGREGLYKIMKGYKCPPSHEDRKSFLNVEDGQIFVSSALKRIPNQDIRSYMFFLNETIEHTQRLRAMARFSKCVCPLEGAGEQLCHFWRRKSVCEILRGEAGKLGKTEEQEMLVKLSEGVDMIIQAQLGSWPAGLDLSPLKDLSIWDI